MDRGKFPGSLPDREALHKNALLIGRPHVPAAHSPIRVLPQRRGPHGAVCRLGDAGSVQRPDPGTQGRSRTGWHVSQKGSPLDSDVSYQNLVVEENSLLDSSESNLRVESKEENH